jgi:response regulator RpfG family c-di-GMP phosphodiesterase
MNEQLIMDTTTTEAHAAFTLLCVDDEANVLNALRRMLRPRGYNVLTAGSGSEGLEIVARTPVDLVISDMCMPEMDGARFLEQVKARSPGSVRILLTGYADLGSTVAAINKAEIYRYIAKPWEEALVLSIVDDVLARKNLEGEKRRFEKLTKLQNAQLRELNATLESKVNARTAELANTLGELNRAHDKLKSSFATSIKIFTNLIELREGAQAGHSRHVAECARRIAQRMKLSEAEVHDITLAGLLHGIGEFGIPDALLRRSLADLSFEERARVMKHPLKAQAALMALEQLADAGKLIRSYRERYDAAGYPDGLGGLAIPPGARVLAVAHDYEAAQDGTLTGHWLSKQQAREHVVAASGTRYDPEVVDAFVGMLDAAGVHAAGERAVRAAQLESGMVLTRDLVTEDGILLLAKDCALDASLIEQIRRYESRDERTLRIHVRVRPRSLELSRST